MSRQQDDASGVHTALQSRAGGGGIGLWSAVVSAAGLAVAGLVGLLLKQPWLFPSLGAGYVSFGRAHGLRASGAVIILAVLLCTVVAVGLNLLAGVRQGGVRSADG